MLLLLDRLVAHGVPVSRGDGSVAVLAGLLALEHLAVPDNAVALALRDVVAFPGLLAGGGRPGKVVAADLHVVVGELAELVVVHSEELGFLGGAEVEAGDEVDGVCDERADDERVGGAGDDEGDLLVDGSKVASDEATNGGRDFSDALKADNVVGAEECVEEKTDHSSDAVLGEHIHGVVDLDPVLDLGGEVGNDAGDNAEDHRSPRCNVTGRGSGGNKTRNETRAPADHGPLARKAPIKKNPSHGAEDTGQVGVPASHDSAKVGAERGTTVECEPAEPQEDGAEGDERDVVRAEVEHQLFLTASQNHRVGKRGHTRHDFDGSATCVVEDTPVECPTARAPHPACNGAVDEGCPEEDEDEEWDEAATLCDSACDNGGGDGAELHLVEGEEKVGDEGRTGTGDGECVHETEFPEVADEAVCCGVAEGQRVSPEVPLEADDRV